MSEPIKIASRVKPTDEAPRTYGFGGSKFIDRKEEVSIAIPVDEDAPKRRGRPPSKKSEQGEYVSVEKEEQTPLNSNMSYKKTYEPTMNMLQTAIAQTDIIQSQLQTDLSQIRASKQLKKKYDYIGILVGASSSLMGSKLSAIRELNSVITNCHNLDMKKIKDLKINEQEDDDKKIADMYSAMLNLPVGAMPSMPFGNVTPMMLNGPDSGPNGMMGVNIGGPYSGAGSDAGYQNYLEKLTPEQNAMIMESNPHIKEVVVYNQETQDKWFDVVDMTTGQSVPNVPRPADFLLKEMRPDFRSGFIRNATANVEYPMVLVGNRAIDEY